MISKIKIAYFLIISILFSHNILFCQNNSIFNREDSIRIKKIFKYLEDFKQTKDLQILLDINNDVYLGTLDLGSRKRNPKHWDIKFKATVTLALQIINERANYPSFQLSSDSLIVLTHIEPPCKTKYHAKVEEIKDEKCKQEYRQLLAENQKRSKRAIYENIVRQSYSTSIEYLVLLFVWNKDTSLEELEKYVSPLINTIIEEHKRIYVKRDLTSLVHTYRMQKH